MLSSAESRASADLPLAVARPTFDEAYEQHFSFVWRSVRGLGVPTHAVDDVAQEVFIVVHRRLKDFEGRSSLRSWVYGILRNAVRAHRRDAATRVSGNREEPVDLDTIVDASSVAPDEALAKREATALLMKLLDAMSDEKREVFVLAELELLPIPDVAAMIGEKLNTVYSRLRLARAELSAAATRHGLHERGAVR